MLSTRRISFGVVLACVALTPRNGAAELLLREIVLHGDKKMTVRAIRARTRLHEGDRITFDVLDEARDKLAASGLLSSVDIWIDLPREEALRKMYMEEASSPIDVHVTLEEKQSWFVVPIFSAGGDDVSGGLVYFDRNLGGYGVEVAGAGQYGETRTFGQAGFRDPIMTFAPITYALWGAYRLERFRFYEDHIRAQEVPMESAGGSLQLGYVFSGHTRVLAGGAYQRLTIDAPSEPALSLVSGEAPTHPLDCTTGMLRDASGAAVDVVQPYNCGSGNVVALQFALTYDDTSAPEGIRKGASVSFRSEVADRFWRSDFDYVELDLKIGLYGYLWRTYPSAILRAALVFPTSAPGVPLSRTFRLGGANLRGYFTDEFHGDTLMTLQLEDQFKLFQIKRPARMNLVGAVFTDVGALLERHPGGTLVTDPMLEIQPRPKLEDLHVGVGVGLRLLLPGVAIPAVRFDFGYGIDVKDVAFKLTVATD